MAKLDLGERAVQISFIDYGSYLHYKRVSIPNVAAKCDRWHEPLGVYFFKILMNVLLSVMSVVMLFIIIMFTGLIYTPDLAFGDVLMGVEFLVAYFLEVFAFLSYALMLGIFVQRSGLTIVLLLLSHMIEAIIKLNIFRSGTEESIGFLKQFFPLESITNLVPLPLLGMPSRDSRLREHHGRTDRDRLDVSVQLLRLPEIEKGRYLGLEFRTDLSNKALDLLLQIPSV